MRAPLTPPAITNRKVRETFYAPPSLPVQRLQRAERLRRGAAYRRGACRRIRGAIRGGQGAVGHGLAAGDPAASPRRLSPRRRARDAENPQGHLWDAAGYNYAAYVTDVDWLPEDVVAFYGKRANMEKAIHEVKEDVDIDRITSSAFGANAADLELKVLVFSVLVLNQRQALGWTVLRRAKTLRRRVIAVAGQVIRTARPWGTQAGPRLGPVKPT